MDSVYVIYRCQCPDDGIYAVCWDWDEVQSKLAAWAGLQTDDATRIEEWTCEGISREWTVRNMDGVPKIEDET